MTETREATKAKVVDQYGVDLLSGRTFALHAASARSAIGYRPPINRDQYSKTVVVLGRMARYGDRNAQVASKILHRLNLYGTGPQLVAAIWTAAGEALSAGYFDTIGNASPEPGRRSDHQHDFTLYDRVAVAHWCVEASKAFDPSAGVGWALAEVAREVGYTHPASR